MAASPEDQLKTMLANIPEKTGKSLDAWKKLIAKNKLEKHGDILKFLKGEHGVTHGFANLISAKARETGEDIDLIAAQYDGPKAALKPLHDAIVKYAQSLGKDVELAPKKTSHSLRRKKQFALITPATKTRIDLGLALKGTAPTARLETYNAMCSHRVRLETLKDFDAPVKAWMKQAYTNAG
jgi:HrpA-like RNA helicase